MVVEQSQRCQRRTQDHASVQTHRFRQLFVFPYNAKPADHGDYIHTVFLRCLPHVGNRGIRHLKRHTFFELPLKERYRVFVRLRKLFKPLHKHADYRVRQQQSGILIRGMKAAAYTCHCGVHSRGIHNIHFHSRRNNCTRLQRFDRKLFNCSRTRPSNGSNLIPGNLDRKGRMGHRIEPPHHSLDGPNLENAFPGCSRVSHSTSPSALSFYLD